MHCSVRAWQAASYKDRWQRSHAEMQNLIARQTREKESIQTYAVQVRTASTAAADVH
jgi:molecular chaperone GrpE (heat shock protein)